MKITAIAVEGVGRFGGLTRVEGLGPGMNILAAPNEAGKSTLFRAVRACLFERHNTRNEAVRSLATDGLALPVTVALGFEHGGEAYALEKAFLKSPGARLRRGGTEIARGREADEMVWELLGIEPGGGRSVDEAAFGILWVEQGQSLRVPEPSEAAKTTLNAAIQDEVGTIVGGERARAVLASVREEMERLVTPRGAPRARGPLAEASEQLAELDRALAEAESRLSVLDEQLVTLAALRGERARLTDPAERQRMADDLDHARRDLRAGEAAAGAVAQAEAAERQAKAALDARQGALAALDERAARIDGDRQRLAAMRETLAALDDRMAQANDELHRARAETAAAEREIEALAEHDRLLERAAAVVARLASREALVGRREALTAFAERRTRNRAALDGNKATADEVALLDEIERARDRLRARREAAAARVAVEIGPAGAGRVALNGETLSADTARPATEPVTIAVADLATITVSPAARAEGADRDQSRSLEARLSELLGRTGAASPAELRAAFARRQALEAEAAGLDAQHAALEPARRSPSEALEEINLAIERLDVDRAETLAALECETLPSPGDIDAQREALRVAREAARGRRQTLDGTIEARNAILRDIERERGTLQGSVSEIAARLEGDLAALPDAGRDRLLAEARAASAAAEDDHRIKAAALEERRHSAPPPEELERRQTRVQRLEQALDNQRERMGALDREIANLEGQIQSAGGDGLGERAGILREQRDLAARDLARHEVRAATLQLLKDTIEACYKEQSERLQAPLRRHLRPFLNDVFPAAELELGDGFRVAGLRRTGPGSETFDRLSAGTQEQLAVLVRLAMGAMLCERGQEVPILLDDALVFSDDERIEQMFDALNRAGRMQQVIVLTCRTRAFAGLGGHRLAIVPDPREAGSGVL